MKIRMYYAPINNMGDDLNRLIMTEVFNQNLASQVRVDNFNIMGIGSCLGECFSGKGNNESQIKNFAKAITSSFYGTGHVWGTGFIEEYPFEKMKLIRKNIKFDMLRGELSRNAISKIIGREIKVPLGDGGLLAPLLVSNLEIKKKYKIGVVPHYREKNEKVVYNFVEKLGCGVKLIDLQNESHKVIEEIASCDYILSSSLHGLIVADAFGIPNTRVKFTDNLLGSGFKFDDYYSAYGIKKHAININDSLNLDREVLFNQPQVNPDDVKQIQENLLTSMNAILKSIEATD